VPPTAITLACPRHVLRDPIPLDPLLPWIEPSFAAAAALVRLTDREVWFVFRGPPL
jgi:hypothetical protein